MLVVVVVVLSCLLTELCLSACHWPSCLPLSPSPLIALLLSTIRTSPRSLSPRTHPSGAMSPSLAPPPQYLLPASTCALRTPVAPAAPSGNPMRRLRSITSPRNPTSLLPPPLLMPSPCRCWQALQLRWD